jgi:hypothetical protein
MGHGESSWSMAFVTRDRCGSETGVEGGTLSIDIRTGLVPHDHVVQFYAHDNDLVDSVTKFMVDGILAGETVIVVATPLHMAAFESALGQAGIDVSDACSARMLVTVDAAQALSRFVIDDSPDPDAFGMEIGGLVASALDAGRRVRIYGEMVALLWEAGNVTAAIELEELWNALGRRLPFSLFCAYHAETVGGDECADSFRHVCNLHSAVVAGSPAVAAADHAISVARAEDARSYACELASPGMARHFVANTLRAWGLATFVDDASIVVAELATIAVLHARSEFVVAISSVDDVVRLSVRDASPVLPIVQSPEPSSISGRGLMLVAVIARRWGIELIGDGKVIWAELGSR